MTEHGAATDAWPSLYPKVLDADILVIAGPIWLGDNSSVTKRPSYLDPDSGARRTISPTATPRS
jgi:hypothetical protein